MPQHAGDNAQQRLSVGRFIALSQRGAKAETLQNLQGTYLRPRSTLLERCVNAIQPHISFAQNRSESRRFIVDGFNALPIFFLVAQLAYCAIFARATIEQ